MNKLKTLLVDDEYSAIEGLAIRLEAFPQIKVVGYARNVADALALISKTEPDLIFLDIEMPGQSGFELIKQLQPENCPAIIFVTAFHQYAVKAFEVRALDYLLKPVKKERLAEAIARVVARAEPQPNKQQLLEVADIVQNAAATSPTDTATYRIEQEKLLIQDGHHPAQLIPYRDILWIDAAGDYMCVHTSNETFVMRARMKSLISEVLPDGFVRIHKSTIVNLQHVAKLEPLINSEYKLTLVNNKALKVSRTYSKQLKESLSA
ncbi:LytR/AlgR family response regulator transcription factor [Rheinheimera nanhaiensis]|uniref:Two-component system, LytT family, response regulator n=1 Tax=Rheinheimera nanhaiensis E407-8 TaxID=562729 RepID=I1DU29_9GAMM|nr:LytTR family transcriptional regulator DNA-binding domain-containing protein [Rheinheimera nanhaiensis]GAB57557.1 two-component system, LytT family, response regulator [Rheinheimera nanhaiensis E407-8]